MYFSKGNRAPICPSSPPLAAVIQAIMGQGAKLGGVGWGLSVHGRAMWHHCSSGDILLFVLPDGVRGEEGSHMVGIYQPMAARVIECELKVMLQTAEREPRAQVWYQVVHHLPQRKVNSPMNHRHHQTYSFFSVSFTASRHSSQRSTDT